MTMTGRRRGGAGNGAERHDGCGWPIRKLSAGVPKVGREYVQPWPVNDFSDDVTGEVRDRIGRAAQAGEAGARFASPGSALFGGTCLAALLAAACGSGVPTMAGPPPVSPVRGPLTVDVVYPPDSARIAARDSNFIFGTVGHGGATLLVNGTPVPLEANGAFLAWLPVPVTPADTVARYDLVASLDGRRAYLTRTVFVPPAFRRALADSFPVDTASLVPRGTWWVRRGESVPVRLRALPGATARLLLPQGDTLELQEEVLSFQHDGANWTFGEIPSPGATPRTGAGVYRANWRVEGPLGSGRATPIHLPLGSADDIVALCRAPAREDSAELVRSEAEAFPESAVADSAWTEAAVAQALDSIAGEPVGVKLEGDEAVGRPALQDTAVVAASSGEDCALVELVTERDTVRVTLPLDLWVSDGPGPLVQLEEAPSEVGTDGLVVGRAWPGGTTVWMWAEGVRARATGRRGEWIRMRLDDLTEAWVAADEVLERPGVPPSEPARVGTVRMEGEPDRLRVWLSVSREVPYRVELDGRRVSLTLYGAYADTDWLRYGPNDPFIQRAAWEQASSDRYVLHLDLERAAWGYRAEYSAGALLLEVRKPPNIDRGHPLRGRIIAVDPGHPPAGATGPTRLYEGDANLAISVRLAEMLGDEGARVVMTRTDTSPVPLYDRPNLANAAGAELLISVHNNALPDGVDPYDSHGTSVYYFHPQSLGLALALQGGLLEYLGLRDLGIGRASLALVRPSWLPAALTEGAFMMIPQQEAALRDPEFLDAYARGLLEGIRRFLRSRAE